MSAYREAGLTVGVIAVDPTSPFTGGALLGDRMRMESVALDPGVFIRSMATRGSLGGLAAATREVADVLDAFGFDRILDRDGRRRTEGARHRANRRHDLVVLVPESGDSIQTLKAGLMEIADIFVVNKADRPGADRLRNEVELMLGLRRGVSFGNVPAHHGVDLERAMNPRACRREKPQPRPNPVEWTPPVLRARLRRRTRESTRSWRHSTGTSVILSRAGRSACADARRLRERVVDVVEQKIRVRLWKDAATMQSARRSSCRRSRRDATTRSASPTSCCARVASS